MGTDLVTNGAMAADSDWSKGTGWTIAAGVATKAAGTESDLEQTISELVQNQTYKHVFTIASYTAGFVTPRVGDTAGTARGVDTTYTEYIKAGSGTKLEMRGDSSFDGSIDNVSLEVAFALVPTWVTPLEPEEYNIITPAVSMKRQRQNIATTPLERFKLQFEGISDEDYLILLNHMKLVHMDYDEFTWTGVPSYIDTDGDGIADGSNMSGYWVKGSFNSTPRANGWDAEITFEKDI